MSPLFSIKGCLPLKVVYHQRAPSIKGRLPSKVVFHQRLSSISLLLSLEPLFPVVKALVVIVCKPNLEFSLKV